MERTPRVSREPSATPTFFKSEPLHTPALFRPPPLCSALLVSSTGVAQRLDEKSAAEKLDVLYRTFPTSKSTLSRFLELKRGKLETGCTIFERVSVESRATRARVSFSKIEKSNSRSHENDRDTNLTKKIRVAGMNLYPTAIEVAARLRRCSWCFFSKKKLLSLDSVSASLSL